MMKLYKYIKGNQKKGMHCPQRSGLFGSEKVCVAGGVRTEARTFLNPRSPAPVNSVSVFVATAAAKDTWRQLSPVASVVPSCYEKKHENLQLILDSYRKVHLKDIIYSRTIYLSKILAMYSN